MAMVLSWEESNYFSSSPIRRSHSQPEFIAHQTSYPKFPSKSKARGGFKAVISPINSASSSAPSSPRTLYADSTTPSYSSTPAHSSLLDTSWGAQDEDQIVSPSYDVGYYGQVEDLEPPASLWAESPDPVEHAEDDTAVRIQPLRNVDYLSHNWREEDIWSSRKHIIRNRKAYNNSARLENASWRTWTKSKTVSPESLNWLKGFLPSGLASPSTVEEKHIHFNEQVEQYIALEITGNEDEKPNSYAIHDSDDSDSDDEAIMMRTDPKWKLPLMSSRKATPRASVSAGSKSIEMLPSTKLKDREDTSELPETAVKHSNSFWNSSKLSPSPSQEPVRDGLGDDDADVDWQPPSALANHKDSIVVTQERLQAPNTSRLSSCLNGDPSGMRRTPSGMFMPYEEDEDDVVTEGLFGKVVDAVNTAKDIGYVIWNVGW
ncbi:hypothetical protein ACEPPN_004027 [Leptodophora sp. 'Broadleaf-Isolate-01']